MGEGTSDEQLGIFCSVMPGLVPGIHVLLLKIARKTWMAGT
jgi:hypothetical protein